MRRQSANDLLEPGSRRPVFRMIVNAPVSYADLGLAREFFFEAVLHAREIRNRYTFLDLAADAGMLDAAALI